MHLRGRGGVGLSDGARHLRWSGGEAQSGGGGAATGSPIARALNAEKLRAHPRSCVCAQFVF